jgi:hypothetical protein
MGSRPERLARGIPAEFAARAAGGTLLGLLSMAAFCLVYARLAHRASWLASAAAGLGAFAVCTLLLEHVALPALAALAALAVNGSELRAGSGTSGPTGPGWAPLSRTRAR